MWLNPEHGKWVLLSPLGSIPGGFARTDMAVITEIPLLSHQFFAALPTLPHIEGRQRFESLLDAMNYCEAMLRLEKA